MPGTYFPGRLGLQQRVLPAYRVPFFDALAEVCQGGLNVFAGLPGPSESIVVANNLSASTYVPAHNRHFSNAASPYYVCWQSGLSRWLEEYQPHVLILEGNSRNVNSRLAVRWMHARRRPVIGWGLGLPASGGGGWISSLRNRESLSFLRSMDAVIAYSRRGAQEYHSLGFPQSRLFVAPNAVEPRPKELAAKKPEEYGERPTVLFVGRLQARKRIDDLLRASAALPEALRPRLLIVGDGPARQDFENVARSVYPSAEFLGERHGADLDPLFDLADLFVLPGTGGLAVQQAMAHGLPVIVAQGDGTQDDLVRAGNGFLVPPGDLAALTVTLQEALSDRARLRRMGAESFRIVVEEVNLEKMVEEFVAAINQVSRNYAESSR
jgi:glycosyltransferase involved in cell wall biosynthesis